MKKSTFFLTTIFFLCSLSNVVIGSDKKEPSKFIDEDDDSQIKNVESHNKSIIKNSVRITRKKIFFYL